MNSVAIVIPIYKEKPSTDEQTSLRQSCREFHNFPIIGVCPDDLVTSFYEDEFPQIIWKRFAPEYFKGISGYNKFMLSEEFYAAFIEKFEYILICQTDVWIFNGNELQLWCDKGFDYIGAPWIRRSCYNKFPLKQWMSFDQWKNHNKGERCRQDLWGKVGNGGLSLRKVKSHYDITRNKKDLIDYYLTCGKRFYAEDIFWGMEAEGFRYPTETEALKFSFDKDPDYCYYKNNFELPFGCHAWNKGRNARFWLPMLGFAPKSNKMSRYPIN